MAGYPNLQGAGVFNVGTHPYSPVSPAIEVGAPTVPLGRVQSHERR